MKQKVCQLIDSSCHFDLGYVHMVTFNNYLTLMVFKGDF